MGKTWVWPGAPHCVTSGPGGDRRFSADIVADHPECVARRLDYESNATGLERSELGMFLVQSGLAGGRDHALACLLALNGLRISEALNADIELLGMERGHRALTITRKGGKIVTIPLAPRTARAVNLCVGEREEGPIFLNRDGIRRLDRHAATRIVKRLSRRHGIEKARVGRTGRTTLAAMDDGSGDVEPIRDPFRTPFPRTGSP